MGGWDVVGRVGRVGRVEEVTRGGGTEGVETVEVGKGSLWGSRRTDDDREDGMRSFNCISEL